MNLEYSSICYIGSSITRIEWVSMKGIFKLCMDLEMKIENCPITIPTVDTYKYYSNYGAQIEETLPFYLVDPCLFVISHFILHL